MKKIGTIIATAAMVLPLAAGAIGPLTSSSSVLAATSKQAAKKSSKKPTKKTVTKKYVITKPLVKKSVKYHGKANRGYFYKGSPAADRATLTLKRAQPIKKGHAYQATQQLTLKLKNAKAHEFVDVKGHGWTALTNLKKVKAAPKAYQIVVGPKKTAKVTYHVNAAKKVYQLKQTGKKAVLKQKGVLKVGTNYQAVATLQLKTEGNKQVKHYLKVKKGKKTLGYVLKTSLIKGKVRAAK